MKGVRLPCVKSVVANEELTPSVSRRLVASAGDYAPAQADDKGEHSENDGEELNQRGYLEAGSKDKLEVIPIQAQVNGVSP